MPTNTCSPARIYGPLPQTIFCGCSVLSFNVSAGWNEQSSSLTVELIQDTCAGPRVWWDSSLTRQQSNDMSDPGFTYPEPGCAVYFRLEENPDGETESERGGFEYSGLVESWNERFDQNGNPVYVVKIGDPRIVLENTQVIVNEYPNRVDDVWNAINAYGYVESLGFPCASSNTGGIGGVTNDNIIGNISNERGMVWNDLKCAIHTLVSGSNRFVANANYGGYCRDNRLVYVGPIDGKDGYGVIKKDDTIVGGTFPLLENANLNKQYYYVDLTEIPFAPLYYRISGPNLTLMEIISQVCADAGCDYYIELLPIKTGSTVQKVIKVRAVVRSSQPQLGRLDDFIQAKQEEDSGQVLSYTKGEEVRNEETTTFLLGGNKKEPFTVNNSQMLPYWGLDSDGNLIQAQISGGEYLVRLDFSRLNPTLFSSFASRYVWVSESELRAAIGDIDTWKNVTFLSAGDIRDWFILNNVDNVINITNTIKAINGEVPAHRRDLPQFSVNGDMSFESETAKDVDKIYQFIRSYADEFYGKQFLAISPFLDENSNSKPICYAIDAETGKYRFSHEPSTDGCWVSDSTTHVLNLIHQTPASDFFRDDSGKYQAIVRFPATGGSNFAGTVNNIVSDPSSLGDTNYITNGSTYIWVKAEVEQEWVLGTPLNPSSNDISAIVKIPDAVYNRSSSIDGSHDYIDPFAGLSNMIDQQPTGVPLNEPKVIDRGSFVFSSKNIAVSPNACLVPVNNLVDKYGPWGFDGLPGQVNLEIDEGFVPWEYGSDNVMNAAALDKVADAVAQMRKSERGSIRVAGFPNIPIGAELFSVDTTNPPDSQLSQKYIGTRQYSIASCSSILPYLYCKMNAWNGEFGPNVTNINVQIGSNGFTTEYQFSTYTPQFGRFDKDNAQRLSRIGKTRLQLSRDIRARSSVVDNIRTNAEKIRSRLENQVARSSRAPKSAHHFLIGRYTTDGKIEVNTQASKDSVFAFSSNDVYASSCISSLDDFYMPVSKSGDGGLPRYIVPINTGKTFDRNKIVQTFFDPLANPNSSTTDMSDSPASGHNIEVLARNGNAPPSGWSIEDGEVAGTGGYSSDYRFHAMRGPIVLQQWGYDISGYPVPNAADIESDINSGIFVESGLQNKFLDGWLQKPKTWPVAPVDLRLDRERGVWTIPGSGGSSEEDTTCDFIGFTLTSITESETGARAGVGYIIYTECDCETVPGSSPTTVPLVDGLGCVLEDYPAEDLIGTKGYARYMKGFNVSGSGQCSWHIVSLCCPKTADDVEPAAAPYNSFSFKTNSINSGTTGSSVVTTDIPLQETKNNVDLNGSNQSVTLGSRLYTTDISNDLFCSAWIKVDSADNGAIIIGQDSASGSSDRGWALRLDLNGNGDKIEFFASDSQGGVQDFTRFRGSTDIVDGNWHHVAAHFRGAEDVVLYVDGIEESINDTSNGSPDNQINAANQHFRVGAAHGNGTPDKFLNGKVYDVRCATGSDAVNHASNILDVVNGTYTGSLDLHWLMDEGSGSSISDSSGNSNDGTISNFNSSQWGTKYSYNLIVNWGDNVTGSITSSDDSSHNYTIPDYYGVGISGTVSGLRYNNSGDKDKLYTIYSWTGLEITEDSTFYGCKNMTVEDTQGYPVVTSTNLDNTFRDCYLLSQSPISMSGFNTSGVETMNYMFANASGFDDDLSAWNVESVISMSGFLSGIGFDSDNYDALLSGWSNQSLQSNVVADFGSSEHSPSAQSFKDTLINTYNWTITDGGLVSETGFNSFASTWDTSISDDTATGVVKLPLIASGDYNFRAHWGDGTSDVITGWNQAEATHNYSVTGEYNIVIEGTISGLQFAGSGDKSKIKNITQWGDLIISTNAAFQGCSNLEITSTTDTPTITTNDLSNTFKDCASLQDGVNSWNISNVSNLESMFEGATNFNDNISSWNISGVQNMNRLFKDAISFNNGNSSAINNWNVSSTTGMVSMLQNTSFDQPISGWGVYMTGVKDISYMLSGVDSFDQTLSGWQIDSIENASGFMENASGMSSYNYDRTLLAFNGQGPPTGITIDFGDSSFTSTGSGARDSLANTYDWTITDASGTIIPDTGATPP